MSEQERKTAATRLLEQTIADLGPRLAERAKEQLTDEIARSMGYVVNDVAREFVAAWSREHLLPEVERQLQAQKQQLIATIVAGMHAACGQLAAALEEKAIKNAANSWTLGKIVKELLD